MYDQYNDLVTIDDLCEMLYIGKNAAYKLLASGQIKAFRYNRIWKVPKQGVIEYVLTQSNLTPLKA
ncbi:MAG: helix-turn-helix domain-containing protein [Sporomusaceae bacterium]|nr:helix-turn-helix domain-containing protein [Sporomusaceae bacterium]